MTEQNDDKIDAALDEVAEGTTDVGTSGEETQRAAEDGDTRDAGETGDDKQPKTVPYQRVKQLSDRLKPYRELGDPEALREKLKRLDEYDKARQQIELEEQRQRELAERDPEQEKYTARFREMYEQAYPGHAEEVEAARQTREMLREQHNEQARVHLREVMEEHGLPVNEKSVRDMEIACAAQLGDPELNRQFFDPRSLKTAVRTTFERYRDNVINPALQLAQADKLQVLAEKRRKMLSAPGPSRTFSAVEFKDMKPKARPGTVEYENERVAIRDKQIDQILDGFN